MSFCDKSSSVKHRLLCVNFFSLIDPNLKSFYTNVPNNALHQNFTNASTTEKEFIIWSF